MALVSENLKKCGVKIKANICGVPSVGSGVVYVTPSYYDYNYVLTAKHILQEDSKTPYKSSKIENIQIFYSDKSDLKLLEFIPSKKINNKIVVFEEDFIILLVKKTEEVLFNPFFVSDQLLDYDDSFFSWGIFKANENEISKFRFKRNDPQVKRFELKSKIKNEYLYGMSGGGLFSNNRSVLFGVISKYPNKNFQNRTIDCSQISFSNVNKILETKGMPRLDTNSSRHKKEINNQVVDIHQVYINNVCLDIEKARKRVKIDIIDDWYHDPLRYIDLLNQDYLFEELGCYFGNNTFEVSKSENFYVPKKKFTLRHALISPFIDRIIYMATVGVLAESMDKAMIPNVFSARYNKFSQSNLIVNGVEQWKKMQYKLSEYATKKDINGNFKYGCIIEIDLLNFYDNINKKLLTEKISRICKNQNEKNASLLLSEILSGFSLKELGIPQNSDASSLLATFYLNQVDVLMQKISPAYFRFMDDIRIFCSNKYEARKILQTFEYEIRRCHLSVNSQKTKILTFTEKTEKLKDFEESRYKFKKIFDLELNKISRLRKSSNYAYKNQAFHLSLKMLNDSLLKEDILDDSSKAKKFNYALNTIAYLGIRDIELSSQDESFNDLLIQTANELKDKPWLTTHVCKVLSLLNSDLIIESFKDLLKEIVINEKYNTYAFQAYQIWLLLAKHKCNDVDLEQYAVKQVEKNDETNRPVIASMIIYLCSVDSNYRRVILRKFKEGFTHGYFQNRIALVSLRSFDETLLGKDHVLSSLSKSHKYTHKYKDKDLVFVNGFEEKDEIEAFIEQLYSI